MCKKNLLLFVVLIGLPMFAFAQYKAVLVEVAGKVEVKLPGSSKWVPATIGGELQTDTIISTGLKSNAVIQMGKTRLSIKPLTRLSIQKLLEQDSTINTELRLTVGKVGVDVQPVSGKLQTFTVSSPVATASVRGTEFEFDGVNLEVLRGEVQMMNETGFSMPVGQGESAAVDPSEPFSNITGTLALLESEKVVTDLFAELSFIPDAVVDIVSSLDQSTTNQKASVLIEVRVNE